MRIDIPVTYPSESLVLFVFSTCHVLLALIVSQAGVLRRRSSEHAAQQKEVSGLAVSDAAGMV